jgi:hypothetical protein
MCPPNSPSKAADCLDRQAEPAIPSAALTLPTVLPTNGQRIRAELYGSVKTVNRVTNPELLPFSGTVQNRAG